MSREAKSHRAWRKLPLAVLASLLITGLFSAGPASAHTVTRTDGNDSPGKLDLRSTSVSHTSTGVVHKVTTYGTWSARSLGNDSFFIIQIDKNNDRNYERCAFIFFAGGRLRGSLTNCGNTFIRYLPVAKLSGTTAKITIPKSVLKPAYWWGVASLWDGPAPCGNGCVDFVPNTFPDVLHDLTPPVVTMTTTPLRVWETSMTPLFNFTFTVSDAHSGMKSWRVERRTFEESTWEVVSTGTGSGTKNPAITGVPGHSFYRVVAVDRHGNVKTGPSRRVYVPRDDRDLSPQGTYNDLTPVQVPDSQAWMETLTFLGLTDSLSYDYVETAGPCRPFELIGPGGGDWTVQVDVNGVPYTTIDGTGFTGDRQVLFSYDMCDSTGFVFTVTEANVEFAVDGIVSKATV
ncbi:MAG TPA: hypothetical protein VMR89_12105 [Actinomycetota bacterium]|nr:hypothetical protein [Actinomycetota bacterium]